MSTHVSPTDGKVYASIGDAMRYILTPTQSAGAFTLIEDTLKSNFHATLHLHREHTETFYIIEGAVTFTVGDTTFVATPGTLVHVTPGTPHSASSEIPGKMLTIFSPGGLDGIFEAFAALTPEQAQDPVQMGAIMEQFDIVDLAYAPVSTLVYFYDLLQAGDVERLLDLFGSSTPSIASPLAGLIEGTAAFEHFVREQQQWLTALDAQTRFVNFTQNAERIVMEYVLDMSKDGQEVDLPVAVVFDRNGPAVKAIRVYHSTWPLTGTHNLRSPLLAVPAEPLVEPAIVTTYMAALHEGNKELLMETFTEDGYVREPSGSRYIHAGVAGRAAFYAMLDAGGVRLHHCTATFDGHLFAVEYICDEWAHTALPPQAGMAIYELASSGKLRAVRIYDDVEPPL